MRPLGGVGHAKLLRVALISAFNSCSISASILVMALVVNSVLPVPSPCLSVHAQGLMQMHLPMQVFPVPSLMISPERRRYA